MTLLRFEGRTTRLSGCNVLGDKAFDRVAAEGTTAEAGEERVFREATPFPLPRLDHDHGVLSKRGAAVLAPLAFAPDVGPGSEDHILVAEADQLGDSQTRLDCHQEKRAISSSRPCRCVGRGEQRVDLWPIKELDGSALVAFARHRQNALAEECMGGLAQGHVAEEGTDCGQASVSCACGVAPLGLEVVEELADEARVEVFDPELRRGLSELFGREAQQQTEGIAVSGDGVGARPSLSKQAVGEEGLQKGREAGSGHDSSSWHCCMRRSVASWRSSGTASMYQ